MKEMRGLLAFYILRMMESVLPVEVLYWILKPGAFVRAALRDGFKKVPLLIVLPGCFNPAGTIPAVRLPRVNLYLDRTLRSYPDRLETSKWFNRSSFVGLDQIRQARQNKRPIILAFCHFGPYILTRLWLRAAGIPVAMLVGGRPGQPSLQKRLEDQQSPFSEIPTTFPMHQLREAVGFLAAGNPLAMAVDYPRGRQMSVPLRDGWTFQMATGAIRLAIRHRAQLIPCCIIREGRWRFRIELGRPVPAEYLTAETDLVPAGKHLIDEMLVHFQNHPDQCPQHLIDRFRQLPAPQN
jgi:Bacterial lipid A biosynthesis acyltransferase